MSENIFYNIGQISYLDKDNLAHYDDDYLIAFKNKRIIKFGYATNIYSETKKPIYIKTTLDSDYKKFEIGNTGIFEMQPEVWYDEDGVKKETNIIVESILVPENEKFIIDYVEPIN